ncbi:Fanconi anemia core complex-associated protein 100 [Conger conger]|uniref:Fanconi anemia core complex-associated protein 100 n=1 Tax=Conger conger TaxID=82655 RepID=UPI002A5A0C51|nr:Fanconi anemia core complex-associated protein 100 [Conger conger]
MSGIRCSVKSLAEFQASSRPAQVIWFGTEPEAVFSNGTSRLFICSSLERGVTETRGFPGAVTQLVGSSDGRGVYALIEHDGVYYTPLPQSPSPGVASSSPGSVRVRSESCVVRDHQVRSFLVTERVLVTVALRGGSWQFGLYEIQGHPSPCYRRLAELSVPALSDAVARADHQRAPPVLSCVRAQGGGAGAAGGHFLLELVLFRLLFGVDVSLLSSPMILCGLPDGRLCCLPLLLPGGPGVRGQCCGVRVLHSLEQPVVFLGGGPSCLVGVGRGGALLQVRVGEGPEGPVLRFEERRVPGPVDSPPPATQPPLSLNVTAVTGLATPTQNPSGAVQLLCVSHKGRLLQVMLPQQTDRCSVPQVSAAQVGQRIRDLLSSISSVADRGSSLESSIQTKRTALRSLNHVLNICSLLRPNQHSGDEGTTRQQPIRCRVAASWVSLLRDTVLLSCVLENSSTFLLESGWALCLQLAALPHAPHTAGPPAQTYTFPLKALSQGRVEVPVALEGEGGLGLPLTVRSWLVYSLQGMLGLRGAEAAGGDCLSLELDSLTLDWLDCLPLHGPTGPSAGPSAAPSAAPSAGSGSGSGSDLVRTFLSSRRAGRRQAGGVAAGGPFAVSVRVSSAMLKGILGMDPAPSSLLAWLLSGPGIERSRRGQGSGGGQGCATVCARGLRLTAREVSVGQVCAGGPVCAVELRVDSASLRLLCGLHHALLHRLQVLFKEVAMTTEPTLQLHGQQLQQVLLQAEALCEEVRGALAPAALGVAQSESSTHKLIKTYQRLREGLLLAL